jgi:hypothetical protein
MTGRELRGLDDGAWFSRHLDAGAAAGRAPDCLGLIAENHLLVGDYLSPCGVRS